MSLPHFNGGEKEGNDAEIRMEQDSAQFSENLIVERQSGSPRLQPWFRSLPVRIIIPTVYRALYSSEHLQPFQLVSLGKTVLRFLTQQITVHEVDREHDVYLGIFDAIFSRLMSTQFNYDDEDFEEFLNSVWNIHSQGSLDFSNTSIPENLVKVCPSRLEQILYSCISSSSTVQDTSPAPLVPLCEKSPDNFLKVMEILQIKFEKTHNDDNPVFHQREKEFAIHFVNLLRSKLKQNYYSLYPSPFHPLLHFTSIISQQTYLSQTILKNELVIEQILTLLDNLFYQCELMKLNMCMIIFTVYAIPEVSSVIIEQINNNSSQVTYKKWPWLKRIMNTQDFKSNFG